MKYGVEVLVAIGSSTHVIKRHDAQSATNALRKAQELAMSMFPEDPMSSRTFNTGRYVYTNKNDLGDLVVIRPFMEAGGRRSKPHVKEEQAVHHGFVFATDGRPDEAA
jgi:hypothetical protein